MKTKNYSAAKRAAAVARALEMRKGGQSWAAIGEALGIPAQTLYTWAKSANSDLAPMGEDMAGQIERIAGRVTALESTVAHIGDALARAAGSASPVPPSVTPSPVDVPFSVPRPSLSEGESEAVAFIGRRCPWLWPEYRPMFARYLIACDWGRFAWISLCGPVPSTSETPPRAQLARAAFTDWHCAKDP